MGWAATADIDNFVFDQAAERYALDEDVANKLQKSNPGEHIHKYCLFVNPICHFFSHAQRSTVTLEAFKNVVRRLLEASGRGMWDADDDTIEKLKSLYADADDLVSHSEFLM